MTTNIALYNYLAPLARLQRSANPSINDRFASLPTLNYIEINVHTPAGEEQYLIEEKDDIFFISKYRRNFLGFWGFKKIAQARSQEDALSIIEILSPNSLETEILLQSSFDRAMNW